MDFTLDSYVKLLEALAKRSVVPVGGAAGAREPFAVLRHFVDREPSRGARMAKLEHRMGVHGTYYFAWDPKLPHVDRGYTSGTEPGGFPAYQVIETKLYGHEVGYMHAVAKGEAVDVSERLEALRKLAPVATAVDASGSPVEGAGLAAHAFDGVEFVGDARGWRFSTGEKVGGTGKLASLIESGEHPRLVLDVHPRLWTHGRAERALGAVKGAISPSF